MDVTGANWRKSSYSGTNGGNCVETANLGKKIAVRDTKDKGNGPVLSFSPEAWTNFTKTLKKLSPSKRPGISDTGESARPFALLRTLHTMPAGPAQRLLSLRPVREAEVKAETEVITP